MSIKEETPDFLNIAVEQVMSRNRQDIINNKYSRRTGRYQGKIWRGKLKRKRKTKGKGKNKKVKAILMITPTKKLDHKQRQMKASVYQRMLSRHPTPAESVVKDILVSLGVKFGFQREFFTRHGFFIVDFYLPDHKIVIEVDGLQHYENKKQAKYDRSRTRYLEKVRGLQVVRLMNEEVVDEPDKIKAYFQRLFEPLGYENYAESNPIVELRTNLHSLSG
jgi:very-short-patch-repair endonuclease